MVRITKVTTKIGDKGMTHLAGGKTITKSSLRIDAIGCFDELNAFLGLVSVTLNENPNFDFIKSKILRIQNELFDLGAQLAVLPEDRRHDSPAIVAKDIKALEDEITEMNLGLPTLKSFVVPGDNKISAYLHVARTVCRRAERALFRLTELDKLDDVEMQYINRLGDWLFVASRYVVVHAGLIETLWQPGKRDF